MSNWNSIRTPKSDNFAMAWASDYKRKLHMRTYPWSKECQDSSDTLDIKICNVYTQTYWYFLKQVNGLVFRLKNCKKFMRSRVQTLLVSLFFLLTSLNVVVGMYYDTTYSLRFLNNLNREDNYIFISEKKIKAIMIIL